MLPLPCGSLLCASTDKCIRYVCGREPPRSYIACGPLKPASAAAGSGPDVRYSSHREGACCVVREEIVPARSGGSATAGGQVAEERAHKRLLAQCHRDAVTALAVANLPSGPVLVSGGRDGAVKAWR